MSGRVVSTIPSHGAVARSVAARAHTAFPACNLRLTFNLPSFINSTVNLSRRSEVNNQTPLLLSSTSTINCFAGCLHKVSAQTFYFSPWKEILFGPLAPAIVGSKSGSIYNRITVKHFSLCLFVTNCQICINWLLHTRCPDSVCVVLRHCCTPLLH